MTFNSEKYHRRSIRLPDHDYSDPGIYFVTICVKNRECVFGEMINKSMKINQYGGLARRIWFQLAIKFKNIGLDKFVVMPNHVHGIVKIQKKMFRKGSMNRTPTPGFDQPNERNNTYDFRQGEKNQNVSLGEIIRSYKGRVTREIHKLGFDHFLWQRNYYERIIRDNKEFRKIQNYIMSNPRQWDLDEENPLNENKKRSIL